MILASSIGKAELQNLTVSGLKLSDRLFQHSRDVSATALTIINDHAKGFHDAKKLALQLYEGYHFRFKEPLKVRAPLPKYLRAVFGDDDAFRALWNHEYTGSKLRGLADAFPVGPELAQLYARINASRLKTPALRAAYIQALDAVEKGAGAQRLESLLKTAYYERNRYFANRIAQTELHRAYTDQKAVEIMADDGFDYIQVRLSGSHAITDICDYHTSLDAYGLGPGIYPKAQAPKPPFHPFCRCLTRPLTHVDGTPRYRPKAGLNYLNSLTANEARQVMGSAEKLLQMKAGKTIDEVVNAGIDPLYHLRRLGEFGVQFPKLSNKGGNLGAQFNVIDHPKSGFLNAKIAAIAAANPAWFPEGFDAAHVVSGPIYAGTDGKSFWISDNDELTPGFKPATELSKAFEKIEKGEPLTFNEEYAIETLWHELKHVFYRHDALPVNRNQQLAIEGMLQFVARGSYSELLMKLGKHPEHQEAIIKRGYAYSVEVGNVRRLLLLLGIEESQARGIIDQVMLKNRDENRIVKEIASGLATGSTYSAEKIEYALKSLWREHGFEEKVEKKLNY